MEKDEQLQFTFQQLRDVLNDYRTRLNMVSDVTGNYYLESSLMYKNCKPLFFGSVQKKKNSIGFHLMPVYIFPQLLTDISPGLRKRMTGKSCFDFSRINPAELAELKSLVRSGFDLFQNYLQEQVSQFNERQK